MVELVETLAKAIKNGRTTPGPNQANEGHPNTFDKRLLAKFPALAEWPPLGLRTRWLAPPIHSQNHKTDHSTTTKPMKLSIPYLTRVRNLIRLAKRSPERTSKTTPPEHHFRNDPSDMGYGDLQSYNPESKSRHAPRPLGQEGRRFTDAHAPAAVCVPTRYGHDRPVSVSHEAWPWPVARA